MTITPLFTLTDDHWHPFVVNTNATMVNAPYLRDYKENDMRNKTYTQEDIQSKGVIIPYADYSKGAKDLANALGMIKLKSSHWPIVQCMNVTNDFCLINWGSFKLPAPVSVSESAKIVILNAKVSDCADKIKFFNKMKDKVRIPEFTTELSKALQWITEGQMVFGRAKRGSGGTDIRLYAETPEEFSSSELFTLYKKKKDEFRVHIVDGEVLLVQKKAVRDMDDNGEPVDKSKINYQIRNHANGFIFKRHDIIVPTDVIAQAKKAVSLVGLDFGAVDVIYNGHEGQAYVLEVNTAPGLEGTTVTDYAGALRTLMKKRLDNH